MFIFSTLCSRTVSVPCHSVRSVKVKQFTYTEELNYFQKCLNTVGKNIMIYLIYRNYKVDLLLEYCRLVNSINVASEGVPIRLKGFAILMCLNRVVLGGS